MAPPPPPAGPPGTPALRNALALRDHPRDSLGSIRPVLESRGYRSRYLQATPDRIRAIDPLEIDILLLLGHLPMQSGPQRPEFAQEAMDLIRVRYHYGLPTLGIDFGAQLIAAALGGDVRPLAQPEIAFAPITLTEPGRRSCLAPLGNGTPVLHWHGHEILLPAGAQPLASTPACNVQAFRHGPAMLGLQFHLEADLDYVNTRLQHWRAAYPEANIDPMLLRMHAAESLQQLRHACHAVMTRWLDEIGGGDTEMTCPAQGSC